MTTWEELGIDTHDLPTTYTTARTSGSRHYFTGKPCKHGHVDIRYAVNGKCATCARAECVAYHYRHLEQERARNKRWIKEHPENNRANTARWKLYNLEKHAAMALAAARRFWNKDPELSRLRGRVAAALRRARLRKAGGTHTVRDILQIYAWQRGKCHWCNVPVGKTFHVDHVIPIARGGSNRPENLCIACKPCNQRKFTKMPYEFAGSLF
jgi:5-methylcytosine-specific restriction endonuclease McrA